MLARGVLAAAAAVVLLGPLGGCGSAHEVAQPPSATTTDAGTSSGASSGTGASGGTGAAGASGSGGSPAARFADCLRDHGVDAIAKGDEVLIAAGGGSVSTGGAGAPDSSAAGSAARDPGDPSPDVEAARTACAKAVPDYRAPDHNER